MFLTVRQEDEEEIKNYEYKTRDNSCCCDFKTAL